MSGLSVKDVKAVLEELKQDLKEYIKMKREVDRAIQVVEGRLMQLEQDVENMIFSKVVDSPTTAPGRFEDLYIDVPIFDDQISWPEFRKQFEVASVAKNWDEVEKAVAFLLAIRGPTTDLAQKIPQDGHEEIDVFVKTIESRYGDEDAASAHMQHVYRWEFRTRRQRTGETLEQLLADIDRLVRLSYVTDRPEFLTEVIIDAFSNAIGDCETKEAVRLGSKKTTTEALEYALAYQSGQTEARNTVRVREVTVVEQAQKIEKMRNSIRCWNCKEEGHVKNICSRRRQGTRPNVRRCWNCEEVGHFERDCRNRRIECAELPSLKSSGQSGNVKIETFETVENILKVNRVVLQSNSAWNNQEIRKLQMEDKDIADLILWKEKSERPVWTNVVHRTAAMKSYWAQWDSFVLIDGVLKRKWESVDGKTCNYQILLPRSEIGKVLKEIQGGVSIEHCGVNWMMAKVRYRFYWFNMRRDIEDWCRCLELGFHELENSKEFRPGDLVWLYNPRRHKHWFPKLQKSWEGPYRVVTRLNDVVYRIQRESCGSEFKVVHLGRLVPYLGSCDRVDQSKEGAVLRSGQCKFPPEKVSLSFPIRQ
uniref:CCHC-type domain-containing protein n=1 Tax=Cacopsylla melanoneura TaxID=428564 RepID=A0A8D9DWF5_9HEMI